MDAKTLKQMVAREAIESVMRIDESDLIVGIGTGSTAECFIAELPPPARADSNHRIQF